MARRFSARNLLRRSAACLVFFCIGKAWAQYPAAAREPESLPPAGAAPAVETAMDGAPTLAPPGDSSLAPSAPSQPRATPTTYAVAADLPRSPRASQGGGSAVPWIALGVGAAGLALGAAAGVAAMDRHSALAAACPAGYCPATERGELDGYHALGVLSTAGFIAGSAGIIAGVVLFLAQGKLDRGTLPVSRSTLRPRSAAAGPTAAIDVQSLALPAALGIVAHF
jgi:hypothetical protein